MAIYSTPVHPDEIYHYGILGQKWGVRRFQNADGTLTTAGRQRHGSNLMSTQTRKLPPGTKTEYVPPRKLPPGTKTEYVPPRKLPPGTKTLVPQTSSLTDNQKKALKIGTAATAAALAVVGTAYLVKSGKASDAVNAGKKAVKQVSKETLSKGKKAVDKVVSYDERISRNVNKVFENTAKGKIKAMSDEQLMDAVKRMSSEKTLYKQQHPFRAEVADIVNKTAKAAVAGAAAYGVGSTIDKRVDKRQLADYMRRGGAKKK